MIEWVTVISLVVIGILFIVLEVIFVPGTTVVGILGLASLLGGVYFGFSYFGATTGGIIFGLSAVVSAGSLIYAFRSGAWEKFSLKNVNKAKYNEGITLDLANGDEGVTTSVLRPIGKAEIQSKEFEVKTQGNYLGSGVAIKIIKIDGNNIFVEPIKD